MSNEFGFHDNNKENLNKDNQSVSTLDTKYPVTYLEKGITQIRVFPAWSEAGMWYKEVKKVWLPKVDNPARREPFISPSMIGQPCPFMEEGQKLYSQGGKDNIEAAKNFRPRSTFLINALIYSSPGKENRVTEGVLPLEVPNSVKQEIWEFDKDEAGGWGDVTSITDGIDFRIEKKGEGKFGTEYSVKPIPKRTNVIQTLEVMGLNPKDVIKCWNLDDVFHPREYATLKEILEERKVLVQGVDSNTGIVNIPTPFKFGSINPFDTNHVNPTNTGGVDNAPPVVTIQGDVPELPDHLKSNS